MNEENQPEDSEDDGSIQKVDEKTLGIAAVTPGNISVKDAENGIVLTVNGGGFADIESVTVGNVALTDVNVADKTSLTGTLKGELTAGVYDVRVKTTDGRLVVGKAMLKVFKAGTATSVKLGCATITADSIGQVSDTKLVASGNVMVNGFLHCAGDMEILVDSLPDDLQLLRDTTVKIGDDGTIQGNSKLYVSYARSKDGVTEELKEKFADLVLGGKDYIIAEDDYYATVGKNETSFDTTVANLDLEIPMIMDIDVAQVKLYSSYFQVNIEEADPREIYSSVKKSLTHKTGKNEEQKVTKRSELNKFSLLKSLDGSLSMTITSDDIHFGGEVKLAADDSINFGTFGINEVSFKLNSFDPDHEYWKIGGKIDFSTSIPSFKDSGIAGFAGYLSSYYWLPDKLEISAELYPGITAFKVIEINKISGSLQGMSTIALKLYEHLISDEVYQILGTGMDSTLYDAQDIKLTGTAEADVDLFASLKGQNALMDKFEEWGELGEAKGEISYNFSEKEFELKAEMSLLGSEKAEAGIKINEKGLDVSAALNLSISGFGCEVAGKADANLGGNLTGGYIKLGVDGNIDLVPADFHAKGNADLDIEWDWKFDKAKVTVSSQNGNGKKNEASVWYEDNGELFLWDRVHTSSN